MHEIAVETFCICQGWEFSTFLQNSAFSVCSYFSKQLRINFLSILILSGLFIFVRQLEKIETNLKNKSQYLFFSVPQWSLFYSTPSPPCITCYCTRRDLRWQYALQGGYRKWSYFYREITSNSWPSLQTVCRFWPMETRKARSALELELL